MEVIGEPLGTRSASSSRLVWRAPTISTASPPSTANTGGASPTPPMSTEPDAMACSIGGPEVKSDQLTLNGSVFSRPAADSTASAPVPFWSPTFSVTEDRSAELDADALVLAVGPGGCRRRATTTSSPAAASPASGNREGSVKPGSGAHVCLS